MDKGSSNKRYYRGISGDLNLRIGIYPNSYFLMRNYTIDDRLCFDKSAQWKVKMSWEFNNHGRICNIYSQFFGGPSPTALSRKNQKPENYKIFAVTGQVKSDWDENSALCQDIPVQLSNTDLCNGGKSNKDNYERLLRTGHHMAADLLYNFNNEKIEVEGSLREEDRPLSDINQDYGALCLLMKTARIHPTLRLRSEYPSRVFRINYQENKAFNSDVFKSRK